MSYNDKFKSEKILYSPSITLDWFGNTPSTSKEAFDILAAKFNTSVLPWYSSVELADQLQSTGTAFVNDLTLNITDYPAGKYKIETSFKWRIQSLTDMFKTRILVDDVEQKNMQSGSPSSSSYLWISYFFYKTLTAGDHTIKLDFGATGILSTVFISDSQLSIFRVGD